MRIMKFTLRRLGLALPQVFGITVITFFLVRLLPGNPAVYMAGAYATPTTVKSIEANLGLDKPIYVQYVLYLQNLVHGNLGNSWFTSRPVTVELAHRLPATLELITYSLVILIAGGIAIGAIAGMGRSGLVEAALRGYGYLAGAFPDFWLGLVLAFIFFFLLGWVAAPVGRLDISLDPPRTVTGFLTIDSVLSGNWTTFQSALAHLALPVITLVIVYMAPVIKLTRATVREMRGSEFCFYARACGLSDLTVARYALRNSLPPVVTLLGLIYGFLLGGAVLVENVFSWGGLGSYVVESVEHSDYFAVQGFVLIAALFTLLVYLVVDIVHVAIDPRVEF